MSFVIIIDTESSGAYGVCDDDGVLIKFVDHDDAVEYIETSEEQYGRYFHILDLGSGDVDEL